MQRTRLNTLFDQVSLRFRQWVFNPWRRIALVTLSLLFGNFFATAISATAGQTSTLDVTIAAILVIIVEVISWTYYRFRPRRRENDLAQSDGSTVLPSPNAPNVMVQPGSNAGPVRSRSTLMESLNAFKLGLTYGLFVEAFKLGS